MTDSLSIITAHLVLVAVLLGAGAWCLLLWAIRGGQFKDAEAAKHRMMEMHRDDE